MPSYSQDFRDIVINKHEEGMTEFELSKFFNIDKRTVVSWIEFYKRPEIIVQSKELVVAESLALPINID
ncbi:transposase family protein [Francisella tularensis]|nr:transposase family protein [Francisella tularensis]